jgi:hypothetical protein
MRDERQVYDERGARDEGNSVRDEGQQHEG